MFLSTKNRVKPQALFLPLREERLSCNNHVTKMERVKLVKMAKMYKIKTDKAANIIQRKRIILSLLHARSRWFKIRGKWSIACVCVNFQPERG